jgi:hypothetical protein
MHANKKYENIVLDNLDEAQELAIKVVMREGALRYKESLIEHLKSSDFASADFNFIDEINNFDENEAIK